MVAQPVAARTMSNWTNPRGAVLGAIVFVGGISSIAIQISAARLIGTTWIIDVHLGNLMPDAAYLTARLLLGGRLADRQPSPRCCFCWWRSRAPAWR